MPLVAYHLILAALCFQSVDVHWVYEIDDEAATLLFGRADNVTLNWYNKSILEWITHLPWIYGSARIWKANDAFWNTDNLKFRWLYGSHLGGHSTKYTLTLDGESDTEIRSTSWSSLNNDMSVESVYVSKY